MRVRNMLSNKGNIVPNQFIITDDQGITFFQSYKSIIAKVESGFNGQVFLDEYYWDYSTTTSRYRNSFLNMSTKEIRAKIKDGSIKLVNLNSWKGRKIREYPETVFTNK